ncbi:MAG TPA: helix-turn-helix transcriptional regulator [Aquimonas sp.]|nr:helix-turn-helix transcriptional regulator [Aquimonas sp.]HRF55382.1 helix-turn-helix transcriptional regulator [Aquimonas sp.]
MHVGSKSMHTTPVGGNIFEDLGFEPEEAAALKAESQRRIADMLAIKGSLMAELAKWIEAEELAPTEAAALLGVTPARLSDAVNKKSAKFTIDAMVDMLGRAGKQVQVSVR